MTMLTPSEIEFHLDFDPLVVMRPNVRACSADRRDGSLSISLRRDRAGVCGCGVPVAFLGHIGVGVLGV